MNAPQKTRRGLSLLEVMAATTIMATLMASSVVVLRSSYAAWRAHESDLEQAETANAVLRHIVRHLRQAEGVAAVTPPSDSSGGLTLIMPDGSQPVWAHDNASSQVLFGVGTATAFLADNIDTLRFTAYEADGVTTTTTPADAQLIRCEVGVVSPTARTVSCTGWIRSW